MIYPYTATCGRELYIWAKSLTDFYEQYIANCIMELYLRRIMETLHGTVKHAHFEGRDMSAMAPGSLETWPVSEQVPLFEVLGKGAADAGWKSRSRSCCIRSSRSAGSTSRPRSILKTAPCARAWTAPTAAHLSTKRYPCLQWAAAAVYNTDTGGRACRRQRFVWRVPQWRKGECICSLHYRRMPFRLRGPFPPATRNRRARDCSRAVRGAADSARKGEKTRGSGAGRGADAAGRRAGPANAGERQQRRGSGAGRALLRRRRPGPLREEGKKHDIALEQTGSIRDYVDGETGGSARPARCGRRCVHPAHRQPQQSVAVSFVPGADGDVRPGCAAFLHLYFLCCKKRT